MSKLIYIVIDGLADLPIEKIGNRTPLEVAHTPNLDILAKKGETGLMYTVKKGLSPESDVAILSILGYDPFEYHTGRGVFEALGADMPFNDGELALRCNFATMGDEDRVIDRRAGRSLTDEEASKLSDAINSQVKLTSAPADFVFKHTAKHRASLVIKGRGKELSANISNTDPAYSRQGRLGVAEKNAIMVLKESWPLDSSNEAANAAMLLNEFTSKSRNILQENEVNDKRRSEGKPEANVILSRDAGDRKPVLYSLNKKYNANFVSLVDLPVEISISRLAGMRVSKVPNWTGNIKEDCQVRLTELFNLFASYDCFFVHLKGPDVAGHDGDCELKQKIISLIDEYFIGKLLNRISLDEYVVCVTADHSTPCELKAHWSNPVPVVIAGGRVVADGVFEFSEKACEKGSLGLIDSGVDFMPKLMSYREDKKEKLLTS